MKKKGLLIAIAIVGVIIICLIIVNNSKQPERVSEQFVEKFYSVSYKDASRLNLEIANEMSSNLSNSDSDLVSYDSEVTNELLNKEFKDFFTDDYFDKIIANGTLMTNYMIVNNNKSDMQLISDNKISQIKVEQGVKVTQTIKVSEKENDEKEYEVNSYLEKENNKWKINFLKISLK